MLSHDTIWKAIDRLADSAGYSPSGLARKAGLDPTTFNKSKRRSADGKPRWPSTESISKILAVTGTTMSEFFALAGNDNDNGSDTHRRLPLFTLATAGKAGAFTSDGLPADRDADKLALAAAASWALEISDHSLRPLYQQGDILIVTPGSAVRRGDRVVVRSRKHGLIVGEIVRRTDGKTDITTPLSADGTVSLGAADTLWMARISWVSQ